MKFLKYKFLLLLLLIPHLSFAYYVCRPCCCSKTQIPGWWGSAEYIFLWRKHRFFPILVTGNPTVAPVLSDPNTEVLFGGKFIGGNPQSGFRGDIGFWLTRCLGFGGDIFAIDQEVKHFEKTGNSAGEPIFGQPFFNTSSGTQDVRTLSFPALQINGLVDIKTNNRLWGLDLYARYRFFCTPCFKFDWVGGFKYTKIVDNLEIRGQSTSVLEESVNITDHFECDNKFYAGMAGLKAEWRSCNWAFTFLGRVGIGTMQKEVNIFGTTIIEGGGITTLIPFGLYAQPSNTGLFKRNKFEVVPQINANLQLKICKHFWATLGYMYVYWRSVALSGAQVDTNINPTQVPGPPVGPIAPLFQDVRSSYWVQGVTAGLFVCY